MRLRVNYRFDEDEKSEIVYQAVVRVIQSSSDVPRYIPDAVADASVESLAQRWFVLNVGAGESDDNGVLCVDERVILEKTKLRDLESRTTLSSRDPVALAALVQRIKRACMFATHAAYFDAMFQLHHEDLVNAAEAVPNPAGRRPEALPSIPAKIADYMNNV
jgi:hypothetical protein